MLWAEASGAAPQSSSACAAALAIEHWQPSHGGRACAGPQANNDDISLSATIGVLLSKACLHLLVAHKLDGVKGQVAEHEGSVPRVQPTPDAFF